MSYLHHLGWSQRRRSRQGWRHEIPIKKKVGDGKTDQHATATVSAKVNAATLAKAGDGKTYQQDAATATSTSLTKDYVTALARAGD